MKFEIGKTYKIDCEEAFVSDSSTNRKIFDMIGSEPWKVTMVDGRDNDVVIIEMKDGKVIEPEEIDTELCVFFTKHDEGIIETIVETEIKTVRATQYKIGSTYKIENLGFRSRLSANRRIYDTLKDRPWIVEELNEDNDAVISIRTVDTRACYHAEDFDVGNIFNEDDLLDLVEIEPESTGHAYAIIDIKGVVHYCTEDQVESRVKDLLTEMPDSSVKVFKFDAEYQASLKIEKI
ncbi:hypothetical protein [Providencia phage PSTRCR_127]|nr:hypothetical protein [Providencia phage PSTRCR_127]